VGQLVIDRQAERDHGRRSADRVGKNAWKPGHRFRFLLFLFIDTVT
jgi:hypothetical protein